MRRPLLLCALLLVAPAFALEDPTRPPAVVAAAAAPASAVVAAPGLQLQGLRQPASALIDGRLRRVGERWDGHELLRIEAASVWLRDPEGRLLRLWLLPSASPEKTR